MSEFDEAKRSCRRRLAGHNERRRKNNMSTADNHNIGSEGCSAGQGHDDRARIRVAIQDNNPTNYKHFHIRS